MGPARTRHVPVYRLRVDDQLEFIYRLTREETKKPYKLNVGDTIRFESLTDKNLDRDLVIQPDGTITLRLLGQVRAAGRTVEHLRKDEVGPRCDYCNLCLARAGTGPVDCWNPVVRAQKERLKAEKGSHE